MRLAHGRKERGSVGPLEDCEIGPLWAKHYPKRFLDKRSKTICHVLCLIVQDKAGRLTAADDIMAEVLRRLVFYDIPKEHFFEVEKELADSQG